MAILEGLLLDNLLENVVRSEVYIAIRNDLDATRFGSGTVDDPYDGSKAGSVYKLDIILNDPAKVPANSTIFLGPGTFYTKGSVAWAPRSGWRIIGSGWARDTGTGLEGQTLLRLEGHTSGQNHAVGMNTTTSWLEGFEMAYLGIDCNFPGTGGIFAGALKITGNHIRIHHIQVTNFGANSLSGPVATIAHAEAADAFDVVMSDCIFQNPAGSCDNATITCVVLDAPASTIYFHRACVVRDTYIDCNGGASSCKFYGISTTGGVGTILEMNRIWNCATAFFIFDGAVADFPLTKDVIIRDNHILNVDRGVSVNFTTNSTNPANYPMGRLVITGNLIELATTGSPIAANISSSALPPSNSTVEQLIIRQNIIRNLDDQIGSAGAVGIHMDCVENAIVEENIINIGSTPTNPNNLLAIARSNTVKKIKTFNNQSTAGVFLGCWNGAAHDGDLVTEIEDMMIGII